MTATHFSFLPGLDLSEALYREAALMGPGSEVLGFDTPQSSGYDWGAAVDAVRLRGRFAPLSGCCR